MIFMIQSILQRYGFLHIRANCLRARTDDARSFHAIIVRKNGPMSINNAYQLGQLCFGFFFNGISNFVGYLMPKLSLLKNSSGTIQPIAEDVRRFLIFQKY